MITIYNNINLPNKALFLDRDGVLIEYIPYLSHPNQIKIPLGAGEALKKWQDAGYLLIAITNQSGVGRGYFTMTDVEAVHNQMCQKYKYFNVYFKDIFVCPHHPSDNCKCRKPSPEMLLNASEKYQIDISQSFFIGDAVSDIQCAINAGCNPVFLLTSRTLDIVQSFDYNQVYIHIFKELKETVQLIPV